MDDDIVIELREWADWYGDLHRCDQPGDSLPAALHRAADEINRLRLQIIRSEAHEIERLRAAGDKLYWTMATCPDEDIIPCDMDKTPWTKKVRESMLLWQEARRA